MVGVLSDSYEFRILNLSVIMDDEKIALTVIQKRSFDVDVKQYALKSCHPNLSLRLLLKHNTQLSTL